MNPEKIGKFICELRKEKNLSQYQLADMIPISRQGVSKWERGVTTPDTQTLIQLSEMFDVTIDELLRGERSDDNSIEKLEETTLSILDQSNKKTKTIKRITITSISIIAILLLAFLSYYFINSYNSMEVYKIGNTSDKFTTTGGIFIVTREKYYLKLGKLKNKDNVKIDNIKIIYKKGNKSTVIIEDNEVDNLMIIDSYGYGEKFSTADIKELKDNLYMQIVYNDTEEVTFKLRYKRYYKNSNLFFLDQKNVGKKLVNKNKESNTIEGIKEETIKIEETKEEIKPTIKETMPSIKQEQKNTTEKSTSKDKEQTKIPQAEQQAEQQEEKQKEEEPVQQPVEEIMTTGNVINKIKETCSFEEGTYACYYENYVYAIMYYENMNRIEFYENFNLVGTLHTLKEDYVCTIDDCKTKIDSIINDYLFSNM